MQEIRKVIPARSFPIWMREEEWTWTIGHLWENYIHLIWTKGERGCAILCTTKLTIQLIFLGKWKKIAVREELEAGRKLPRWTNARQYFVGCQKSC